MIALFKKTSVIVTLCLLGGALGFAASRTTALKKPQPAPTVHLTLADGRKVTLDEWKGKLLLINFWATWCAPCRKEMPALMDAQKRYGARGLQIIGPALDDEKSVRELATKLKINYPVMADDGNVEPAMMLLGNAEGGLPYSVLIDPQGRIVKTVLGDMSSTELDGLISDNLPAASK